MAKKTTRRRPSKRARAVPPKRQAPPASRETLLPERDDEVIVRMYRQGLGDCFLIALPTAGGAAKYVLIDCGVHKRQTDGPARLAMVLKDLAAATSSRLDVIVATHEHADHLSGFVQKGSPFLTDTFTIGQVWLAWTEKRGDRQADTLRRKRGTAQRLIDKAVDVARNKAGRGVDGPGLAARLEHLTDFDTPAEGSVDLVAVEQRVGRVTTDSLIYADDSAAGLGVAKGSKKKRTRPSSNELALRLLVRTVGDNGIKYCEPGKVRVVDDVPNFRAYVLGPPRSDLLEKEGPSRIRGAKEGDPGGVYKEVYLTAAGGNRALALNPRFDLKDSAGGAPPSEDWRYPFASRYRHEYTLKTAPAGANGGASQPDVFTWATKRPTLKETRSFIKSSYLDPRMTWRRIDGDWLNAAEALALNLASDTNNTSLALAFEWGKPGKGRVLLFAADAQVGNWLSWRDQDYGERGESKAKIDQLLDRVLLYKVGHHGSHNATVRRDPRDLSSPDPNGAPFGLELMNDIIAMIPVDHDSVRKKMPDPWLMPHEPLYKRLRDKARRRVLRSDLELKPLDRAREDPDVVPESTDWTAAPGLPGVRWRRSKDTFAAGTEGPLYHDVAIKLPD